MNDKITELAKQAGFYVYNGVISPTSTSEMTTDKMKIFAELIIKEAMEIVRDEVSFHSDWACADNATKKVNEHFGV